MKVETTMIEDKGLGKHDTTWLLWHYKGGCEDFSATRGSVCPTPGFVSDPTSVHLVGSSHCI